MSGAAVGTAIELTESFVRHHPYAVIDRATGEVVRRFSNLRAALESAQVRCENYPRGLEVTINGAVVARWGPREGSATAGF